MEKERENEDIGISKETTIVLLNRGMPPEKREKKSVCVIERKIVSLCTYGYDRESVCVW